MRRIVFKVRFFGLVLLALVAGAWPVVAQAAPTGLAGFTVLSAAPGSGGAVTCTRSTIHGNVGSSGGPASVTTTCTPINGTITTSVSTAEFNSAYSALAPKTGECTTSNTLTGSTLAGLTLAPGVYCLDAVAKTGLLTLNGPPSGIWIFKTVTGALTGTDFSVVMAGGGLPCNVNWWVAQAASLTVDIVSPTPFVGTILAGAAITLVGHSGTPSSLTVTGRLWARAAVSMTDSTVTPACTSPVPGTNCKPGTSTDTDENSEQSKDTSDSNKSASSSSNGDNNGKNSEGNGDKGTKGCDSENSKQDNSNQEMSKQDNSNQDSKKQSD